MIHEGDLTAAPGVVYATLTHVTGTVFAIGASAGVFPALTAVGGSVFADSASAGAFPALTTVGRSVYADSASAGVFPALTTVGRSVDATGASAGAFPALVFRQNAAALARALAAQGLTLDDGILCHIVRRRGAVTRVRRVGATTLSYLVREGPHTAHGATLAEARADLRFKQGGRDTTPYRHWTPKTMVSKDDAILAYRAVTGACREGVAQWLAGRKVPARLSVARVLRETEDAYGAEAFAAFITQQGRG